jgi:hypothetical protein
MKTSDIIGTIAFAGGWLLIAPLSFIRVHIWMARISKFWVPSPVARLYSRFDALTPKPSAIRIIGLAWIVLVISVAIWGRHAPYRAGLTKSPFGPTRAFGLLHQVLWQASCQSQAARMILI